MTPKEEVIAALLNNANISKEAMNYLKEVLNNESSNNSNSGILYIKGTVDDNDNLHLGKSYAELIEAFNAGKTIVLYISEADTVTVDTEGSISILLLSNLRYYSTGFEHPYSATFGDSSVEGGNWYEFVAETSTEEMVITNPHGR